MWTQDVLSERYLVWCPCFEGYLSQFICHGENKDCLVRDMVIVDAITLLVMGLDSGNEKWESLTN